MAFQVGDKVRFTDECFRDWWFGPHKAFKTGTITRVREGSLYKYTVRVDGRDWDGGVNDEHIELVQVAQPVAQPQATVTFYTIVYKPDPAAIRVIKGFETEESFNTEKARLQRIGCEIIASKKIKLTNV